jgi:hypothetical protein
VDLTERARGSLASAFTHRRASISATDVSAAWRHTTCARPADDGQASTQLRGAAAARGFGRRRSV